MGVIFAASEQYFFAKIECGIQGLYDYPNLDSESGYIPLDDSQTICASPFQYQQKIEPTLVTDTYNNPVGNLSIL